MEKLEPPTKPPEFVLLWNIYQAALGAWLMTPRPFASCSRAAPESR